MTSGVLWRAGLRRSRASTSLRSGPLPVKEHEALSQCRPCQGDRIVLQFAFGVDEEIDRDSYDFEVASELILTVEEGAVGAGDRDEKVDIASRHRSTGRDRAKKDDSGNGRNRRCERRHTGADASVEKFAVKPEDLNRIV